MNLLETRPGAGVFVSELDVASLVEPLSFAVALGPPHLRSVIQARMVIEPGIAGLAAQFGRPEEIDRLYALIERSSGLIDEAEAFLDVDIEIHDAIVAMAGNTILAKISDAIRRVARASQELTNTGPAMRRGALEGHRAIFDGIAARNPARAATAMREHLEFVEEHLFDYKVESRAVAAMP
jgi:GntR family transcriptional repressor for pyruvate dehydrogenase complex